MTRRGLVACAAALASFVALTLAHLGHARWTNFGGADEWLVLSLSSRGILDFPHSNRPLNLLWSAPAVLLTPNRFEGFLWLHLAYLALTGWLTWLLVRRLEPSARTTALLAGAFAVTWAPLDMARLAPVLHAMNSGATFGALLAVVLFVEAALGGRLSVFAAAAGVAFLAARSYEATLGLLLTAPLLLLLARGRTRMDATSPRLLPRVAVWLAWTCLLALLAIAPLLSQATDVAYQTDVLGVDVNPGRYLGRLALQFRLQFEPLLRPDPSGMAHSRVAYAVLAFAAALLATGSWRDERVPLHRLLLLGALGVALTGAGYSVLVLSANVVAATRTQFLSGPGVGLLLASTLTAGAAWLPRRIRTPAVAAIAASVVAIGTGQAVAMQREWDRISAYDRQRDCMAAFVRQAPALRPGTLLLLIDEDGSWPFAFGFHHAVRVVYGESVSGHVVGRPRLLYDLAATPRGLELAPWPIVQGPWHERPREHRYGEVVVFRWAEGSASLLSQWPDRLLGPLPDGARYAPGDAITDEPPPPGRRVLD